MVVSRALRASSCTNCRISLLRSFTSVAGHSFRGQQIARRNSGWTTPLQFRRSSELTDGDNRRGNKNDEAAQTEAVEEQLIQKVANEHLAGEGPVAAIPWYLQVDAPQKEARPLSGRQRIPGLPEGPPPLLQPLLQQISVDLGLDDLTLLDLRKLDPPPALGANLLMIISTARSEKHLHVSADRLCRWLRSTYKLRPDADGLLGRNELKLKLKRKAKRAKLIGSTHHENGDDGVRTGWVCVDVGVVDGGEVALDSAPERKDFVGFGRRTDGVRIVVQMLTEEKREEIDLDQLWGGILKRGGVAEVEDLDVYDASKVSETVPQSLPRPTTGPADRPPSILAQIRGFHTSARRLSSELDLHLKSEPDFEVYSRHGCSDLRDIREKIQRSFTSGDFEKAKTEVLEYTKQKPLLQNEEWRRFLLHGLRSYLERLPWEGALDALGIGSADRDSTPFLRCFYQTLTSFPTQAEAEARLWLCCWARFRHHPGYNTYSLVELFHELQDYGVKIGLGPYLDLLREILRQDPETSYYGRSKYALEGAMQVLQAMHDQGFSILDEGVLLQLQRATAPGLQDDAPAHATYKNTVETFDLPSLPLIPIQKRLHLLITRLDLPLFDELTRMALLDIYAGQHNWLEFWEIWGIAARHGKPRSAEIYSRMFIMIAQTGSQKACMNVLRTWVPEMEEEEPAIPLEGDVAYAVKYCLKVADPNVEQDAMKPEMQGEWVSMWRSCGRTGEEEESQFV